MQPYRLTVDNFLDHAPTWFGDREGDALRFGHFCDVCSRAEPAGWFATSSAGAP